MKSGLRSALFFIIFGLMIISSKAVKAQCAQCAATVESNAKSGDKTANGLNAGILFLLAAPYTVIAVGGFIWYRNYRRKNMNISINDKKLNLN